jgi:hypothetical protein
MCLPVSRLFWVSSLAYPNLLGTKGYVVVVVVVHVSTAYICFFNQAIKDAADVGFLVSSEVYFLYFFWCPVKSTTSSIKL